MKMHGYFVKIRRITQSQIYHWLTGQDTPLISKCPINPGFNVCDQYSVQCTAKLRLDISHTNTFSRLDTYQIRSLAVHGLISRCFVSMYIGRSVILCKYCVGLRQFFLSTMKLIVKL